MPISPIDSFLAELGLRVDTASFKKGEEVQAAAEKRISAAQEAEAGKRAASDKAATGRRATTAQQLAQLLTALEQDRADRAESIRKAEAAAGEKRDAEVLKHATERRDALVKSTRGLIVSMAALPAALALGVTAAATGLLWATERAAKGFERLYYTAANSGSSAAGLTKFEYAASRLGTTAEDARASVAAFGENLKKIPALEGVLKSMGIRTREANGELRDASELTKEYVDHLKALPQLQREAQASAWGITNATTRAVVRPEFGAYEAEQDRINGIIGADPNKAAAGGAAFESAMKRVEAILGALGTRVETSLFDVIKPRIDAVAQWVLDHGDTITNFVNTTAKGLTDLATAFAKSDVVRNAVAGLSDGLERAAKYVASDQFRKDIQTFVDDVQALAHAIRTALEWIGVLPDRNAAPSKAAINGGHPDLSPRDNDLGLPGVPDVDQPQATAPSDTAAVAARANEMAKGTEEAATGFWGWVKTKAKEYGFGDRVPGVAADDRKVKADIAMIAESTKKLADGAGGVGGVGAGGGVTASSGGLGGSGRHIGGGSSPGAALRDHALSPRSVFSGKGDIGKQKASTLANGDESMRFWLSKGVTSEVAAGLVGMEQGEALYDPSNKTGDGGNAHGSFQWHKPRRDAIRAATGIDIDTATHAQQLEAAYWEFTQGKDSQARAAWRQMTQSGVTAAQAAAIGTTLFERPLDKHGESLLRGRYAEGWLKRHQQQGATAQAPVPAGASAAAIGDAAVFAARQRMWAGGTNPHDLEIVKKYLQQQNGAKLHTSFAVPPSGITPSLQASYNNSRTRGDTIINSSPTFNVSGGDVRNNMEQARMVADRGTKDLIRNVRAVEV